MNVYCNFHLRRNIYIHTYICDYDIITSARKMDKFDVIFTVPRAPSPYVVV